MRVPAEARNDVPMTARLGCRMREDSALCGRSGIVDLLRQSNHALEMSEILRVTERQDEERFFPRLGELLVVSVPEPSIASARA